MAFSLLSAAGRHEQLCAIIATMANGPRGRKRGVKRELLRQAVEENVRTKAGQRARKHRPKRITSRALWLAATAVVLAAAAYFVPRALGFGPEDQGFWAVLVRGGPDASSEAELMPTLARSPAPLDSAVFPVAVRRIVLDPGHGGRDGGSTSTTGLVEKDLTLDIAQRLRRLLEEEGRFEVHLTREEDDFLDLRDRAERANELEADLFVSIHLNWLEPVTQRGVETFFLGPTEDPELVALTHRENQESGYSLADVRRLLDGIYLDLRQEQSERLATSLQRELFEEVRGEGADVRDRGAKAAPFLVLVTTEMPAALVEVAALSHQAEVQLLQEDTYRQRLAQSLYRGLVRYADGLRSS